jgi:hypothetical protein
MTWSKLRDGKKIGHVMKDRFEIQKTSYICTDKPFLHCTPYPFLV